MKDFSRADRLSSQINRELSNLLINTVIPPADTIISFTGVELTKDLRFGKVYYSVYGSDQSITKAETFFKDNFKQLKKELAGKLRIRFMPELKFIFDPSIEREQRIAELLDRIKEDNEQE